MISLARNHKAYRNVENIFVITKFCYCMQKLHTRVRSFHSRWCSLSKHFPRYNIWVSCEALKVSRIQAIITTRGFAVCERVSVRLKYTKKHSINHKTNSFSLSLSLYRNASFSVNEFFFRSFQFSSRRKRWNNCGGEKLNN